MEYPTIDVLLPVYGDAPWLGEAIESVAHQGYGNWHLYVVADGPEGYGAAETAERTVGELGVRGKTTIVRLSANRGAPGARMEGASRGGGELLAFIDQDDVWRADKLEVQVAALSASPQASLAHSDIMALGSGPIKPLQRLKVGLENRRRYKTPYEDLGASQLAGHLFARSAVRLGTVLVGRQGFYDVGGFNSELFGGEDTEFLVRLSAEGWGFVHCPAGLVYRRVHGGNVSTVFLMERLRSKLHTQTSLVARYPFLAQQLRTARRYAVLSAVRHARTESDWREVRALAELWNHESGTSREAQMYAHIAGACAAAWRRL